MHGVGGQYTPNANQTSLMLKLHSALPWLECLSRVQPSGDTLFTLGQTNRMTCVRHMQLMATSAGYTGMHKYIKEKLKSDYCLFCKLFECLLHCLQHCVLLMGACLLRPFPLNAAEEVPHPLPVCHPLP